MFYIVALYLLLVASIVVPPLLLISIPLFVFYLIGLAKRRRMVLDMVDEAEQAKADKRRDAALRYFR